MTKPEAIDDDVWPGGNTVRGWAVVGRFDDIRRDGSIWYTENGFKAAEFNEFGATLWALDGSVQRQIKNRDNWEPSIESPPWWWGDPQPQTEPTAPWWGKE